LLAQGVRVPVFRVRDRDRALIAIDPAEIASPYPFTLMVPQDKVEGCLLGRLEVLGAGSSGLLVRPAGNGDSHGRCFLDK